MNSLVESMSNSDFETKAKKRNQKRTGINEMKIKHKKWIRIKNMIHASNFATLPRRMQTTPFYIVNFATKMLSYPDAGMPPKSGLAVVPVM